MFLILTSWASSKFCPFENVSILTSRILRKFFCYKRPVTQFLDNNKIVFSFFSYFPRPQEGQTLLSFLTSSQFTRANAELDRENAHFNISEAMISAMEQIRCKRDMTLTDDQAEESDPEIVDLKQRIRLRRRQKLVEIQRKMWTASSLMSDGKTDSKLDYNLRKNHKKIVVCVFKITYRNN